MNLELRCPRCTRVNDRHAGQTPDDQPSDGALGICWACQCIGIFVGTPPTSIRIPTPAELDDILADPNVQAALMSITHATYVGDAIATFRRNTHA